MSFSRDFSFVSEWLEILATSDEAGREDVDYF